MSARLSNAKQIFLEAVEHHEPDQWPDFLRSACGTDGALRQRVQALLDAHTRPNKMLDGAGLITGVGVLPDSEPPGSMIGPYKLLEPIGEGGFGVVYLAEQTEPIRRRVALKIIKPGMDTRQVIARFEAEQQAIALMDHPNIAKVHDAGVTESGRPYFVMELVQGVPITEYCDRCNLTARERMELFVTVCHAVQHAHQKGVIHRDLKPSNVLVAIQDGIPTPKIIDFGIAKAINQPLTEHTFMTGFAQMVGTPLYMSPEQAELSPLGVDTRSDVYSLGVLLYELLTGTTPFESDRLRAAAYDELRRIIREEEPPRPSARISTLAAGMATTVAERRGTDSRRLLQAVRGELDWIVMKCLEKERNRRYETAGLLAQDVQRYLADEPVEACPPSTGYRMRKFVRRNKGPVLAGGTVILALVAGVIGTTLGMLRAEQQRHVAEDSARKALAAAAAESKAKEASKAREAETTAVLEYVEDKLLAAARPEGDAGGLGHDVTLRRAVEANKWYERAQAWMEKNDPGDEALRRFQAEAGELLGIGEPEEID